jgi:Tfp pilus assembly protein PilO
MKRSMVIATVVAIAMVAAFWFAGWSPASHRLASAHHRLDQAQAKNAQLNGQLVLLRAEKKNEATYVGELVALEVAVPTTPALDTVFDQLYTVAQASGVNLTAVNPSTAAAGAVSGGSPTGGAPAVQLAVSASGSYHQVVRFVTLLQDDPRLFVVDSIGLQGGSGTAPMTASLQLRAFYTGG